MKIELTIKTSYLPEWGISEGIRELVQNAKDADTDGYPMSIKVTSNKLKIENSGALLPHECLLFGHTTKTGRDNQIGKFGEGLKLGTLALVRAGRKVIIRSGGEIWEPYIGNSTKFNSEVLIFNVRKAKNNVNSVIIEVESSKAEWEEEKEKFLFLKPIDTGIHTSYGTILLDNKFKGKVYVKGIFVQDVELTYGYNIDTMVDRDRKMINSYDLEYALYNIWISALCSDELIFKIFFELLKEDSKDVAYFQKSYYLPPSICDRLKQEWVEEHGEKIYPVLDLAHAKELEYLGARGLVTSSKSLVQVYSLIFGKATELQKELGNSIVKKFRTSEIPLDEVCNLKFALFHVERALKQIIKEDNKWILEKLNAVRVVDFNSTKIKGLFKNFEISISRSMLFDYSLTTEVLVHEISHCFGGDGEKNHDDIIQKIWRTIFKNQVEDANLKKHEELS
jgi:hypothetical protein